MNNKYDRCLQTRVLYQNMVSRPGKYEGNKEWQEQTMNEQTTYTIASGSEYWGDGTDEEIAVAIRYEQQRIEEFCREQGWDVEIRVVPERTSYGNQPSGDEEIIAEIEAYVQQNWDTWLAESLVQDERAQLDAVMTVSEVAEEYGVEVSTIRRAAINGWILARKSGSTWLIRRADALARWGGKLRSILLTLVSVGLSLAIWATMA